MRRLPLIASAILVACIAGGAVQWSRTVAIGDEQAEFESYGSRDGKKEAEADIAKGEPKWKVSGLYRHFDEDSARLAKLGIKVDVFAGCVVTEGIVRYRFRYNSTIYSYYVDLVGKEITEEVLGSPPVDELSHREEKG